MKTLRKRHRVHIAKMATVSAVRFCFGCGFKVEKNFRFYPKCGIELTTERQSTNTICDHQYYLFVCQRSQIA